MKFNKVLFLTVFLFSITLWSQGLAGRSFVYLFHSKGIIPPKVEQTEKPKQDDMELNSIFYRKFTFTLPYRFGISQQSLAHMPNRHLIFQTLGNWLSTGTYASEMLAELVIDEQKSEARLQLRDQVQFYRWDAQTNQLTSFPATVDDLLFSVRKLQESWESTGYGEYWNSVTDIKKIGQIVYVTFNPEKLSEFQSLFVYIINQTHLLPRDYYQNVDFNELNMDTHPIGAGPYFVKPGDIDRDGTNIVYSRVDNHWSDPQTETRSQFHFSKIRMKYFEFGSKEFALSSGEVDSIVYNSKLKAHDAVNMAQEGNLKVTEVPTDHQLQTYITFNLQRVKDPSLRKALTLLFRDWFSVESNREYSESYKPLTAGLLFESQYTPSPLIMLPSEKEKLASVLGNKPELFDTNNNYFDTSFDDLLSPFSLDRRSQRISMRRVASIMAEAGYALKNGFYHKPDGERLKLIAIESLSDPNFFDFFSHSLQQAGFDFKIERIDHSQFTARKQEGDYDLIKETDMATKVPFNSYYRARYHSSQMIQENYGMDDPAIDLIIDTMTQLPEDMTQQKAFIKAIDRIMAGKAYRIPIGFLDRTWIVHQNHLTPVNRFNGKVSVNVNANWIFN